MPKMTAREAIAAIDRAGCLLVYPINNRKEPHSLWAHFFPRKKMLWEWTDDGDHSVAELWHLREELSRSRRVVYAKWYRGRATFFSRRVAAALVHELAAGEARGLSAEARALYGALEEESPLSTKELKRHAGLVGRFHERAYEKALKELWARLLIVGFGEQDDGAFPSLVMGATKTLFEDLWTEARGLGAEEAQRRLEAVFPPKSLLRRQLDEVRAKLTAQRAEDARPKVIRGWG